MQADLQQALEAATPNNEATATPITTGLINKTYKITVPGTNDNLLLQQVNTGIFPEPAKLLDNYNKIWLHLDQQLSLPDNDYPISIPAPRDFTDGSSLFRDRNKHYWRLFEFVEDAATISIPASKEQARQVATVFASLTNSFDDYPILSIDTSIPGFHDLSLRFGQFRDALHSRHYDRLQKSVYLIEQLKKRERYVSFYEVIIASDEFKQRLMHHDAKISNILFHEKSAIPVCPVDLDTCMPGYFFSDIGDMIRSMAGSTDEAVNDPSMISIRKDYYDAILEGYLDVLAPVLTDSEKKYIHYAGPLVTYMQALRFITDYLKGDVYYRTDHAHQNFERANNQLTLLKKLEAFLSEHYQFSN